MRILVTNDDGIDSVGLHELARALRPHGEIVIVAPDEEYSGAGAAVGTLHLMTPEVHEAHVDGIDTAWAVSGPPALCVMFARLGLFGGPFDLVVAGINPGANVGRSVYHSGTVGAALTARNGGINAVAVSQSVEDFGVEGQGWEEMLEAQRWHTAARVAQVVVGALVDHLPDDPRVLNVNVPNLELDDIAGWRHTTVGRIPPRSLGTATLEPRPGHAGSYRVSMTWGDPVELPRDTDGGAVMAGEISLTWLSRIDALDPDGPAADATGSALDDLLG